MKTCLALVALVGVAVVAAPGGAVAAEPPAVAPSGSTSSAAVAPVSAATPSQPQVTAPSKPPAPGVTMPGVVPSAIPAIKSDLSDSAKLEKSAEAIARIRAGLKQVLGRVEEARNEKDVVKLNCVNEKLTQIKGLLKVAEQSDLALNEALAARQPSADAEFAKINIARGKVDGLKADAEQCIGQLAYIIDEKTTVDVSQPTNLPNVDGARLFGAGQTGLAPAAPPPAERPVPASP